MKENYCTAFPDKILGTDISQCCKAHDDAYSPNDIQNIVYAASRYEADVALLQCVQQAFPTNTFLAITIPLLMFAGVRLFGWKFFKKK